MASAVSSSSVVPLTDPTSSLQQALSAFENCLTDEQRRRFHGQAAASSTEKAIAFAQQIDADKINPRRCAFNRVIKLLEATKQFSDIVDTFVSSNPPIAGLVWGSLKTAILAASNVCSYFEKVTRMIMEIGKTSPTYEQFAGLYPDNVDLQRSLSDYFAVIIRICTRIVEVSRRSTISHTFSSIMNPFESDFGPLCEEVNDAKGGIQLQVSLASKRANAEMKKLLEHECDRNSSFRLTSKKLFRKAGKDHAEARQWHVRNLQRETENLRSRIRDNFSTINFADPWTQVMGQRIPGTAEWLQREPVFESWLNDQASSLLWCTGTMGIGKTVLMSSIVALLKASGHPQDILAYYFCCADDEKTLQGRNIVGTLYRQLLDNVITAADKDKLERMQRNSRDHYTAGACWWVDRYFEESKPYFLIIDGLDECQDEDLRQIDELLAAMLTRFPQGCKILCTSRPELERRLFKTVNPTQRLSISRTKVRPDTDRHVTAILQGCLDEGRLRLGDPALQPRIAEVLQERADGMFLWTRLVIEELCAQNSDNDLLKALEDLPRGLSEIFDRTIARIKNQSTSKQATRMLQFCGVVKQPLKLVQYKEVLGVSPGQKSIERTKYPNSMDLIVSNCYGLMFVDEEKETVHFTHRSIQQYLFAKDGPCAAEFAAPDINVDLGVACMTYLNFSDFKRQMVQINENPEILFKPRELGLLPISSLNGHLGGLIRQRLQNRQSSVNFNMREVVKKTQEAIGRTESSRLASDLCGEGYHFLEYARRFWIYHSSALDSEIYSQTWMLFRRCVEGIDVLADRPWESSPQHEWSHTIIPNITGWLLDTGNHALLLYQIRHQPELLTESVRQYIIYEAVDLDLYQFTETMIQSGLNRQEDLQFGLKEAARRGRVDAFERYRKAGADVCIPFDGDTLLQVASTSGSCEIVRALLIAGLDLNDCGSMQETSLRLAFRKNHLQVAEILLHAGAKIDEPATAGHGMNLLQEVAYLGYSDAVERLLLAGADVNAAASKSYKAGRTALQAAAENDHYDIVVRLLVAGADVNAPYIGFEGRSALQWAAECGNLEMVDILLESGADVNAPAGAKHGSTALQAAANAPGYVKEGNATLQTTAYSNDINVVRRLLAWGADVNAPYTERAGHSALQNAVRRDNMEMVSLLLDAGADVNASASNRGHTALHAAVENGNLGMVDRLLAAGADVDAPGPRNGQSAYQYACRLKNTEIIERLRSKTRQPQKVKR